MADVIFDSFLMCVQNFNSIRPYLNTFFNVHTQFYGMGALGAFYFRSIVASDLKIGRYHYQHLFYVCAKISIRYDHPLIFFKLCTHKFSVWALWVHATSVKIKLVTSNLTDIIFISCFKCVQNFNWIRPYLHTFFNVHTQFYSMGALGACNFP